MLAKSSKDNQPPGSRQSQEAESGHPVIRTLYDHFEVIINIGGIYLVIYSCCCVMLLFHTAMQYISSLKNNKPNCPKCAIEFDRGFVSNAFLLATNNKLFTNGSEGDS